MRCPNCDGRRIVLAAPPGEQPDHTCVCLACGHLWDGAADLQHARSDAAHER